jgi:hypothetical protein
MTLLSLQSGSSNSCSRLYWPALGLMVPTYDECVLFVHFPRGVQVSDAFVVAVRHSRVCSMCTCIVPAHVSMLNSCCQLSSRMAAAAISRLARHKAVQQVESLHTVLWSCVLAAPATSLYRSPSCRAQVSASAAGHALLLRSWPKSVERQPGSSY